MYRTRKLQLLGLERRDVPAQFGVPWANHQITLSFVPDGTNVDGRSSNLMSFLSSSDIGLSNGKEEILRAVQEWTNMSNLSVSVVPDDGTDIGAAGQLQHDLRFGDIRVSGRPMSESVLAITVPPGPASGTRAGDIIINTGRNFCVGSIAGRFDLYSCMLQETGHALGVGNSSNIDSPMYETYQGVRSGLLEEDQAVAIGLYGERMKDSYDVVNENGNAYVATTLATPASLTANAESTVEALADISSTTDRDYYSFVVPQGSANDIAIRLVTNGVSLLRGRMIVLSEQQDILMDVKMDDSSNGVLADVISTVSPGEKYYVCIKRANDTAFNIGQYRVQVDFNPTQPGAAVTGNGSSTPWVFNDQFSDENVASARPLTDNVNRPGEFGITATFLDSTDVDTYVISVPSGNDSALLTVTMNAAEAGMRPMVTLLDSYSNPIAYQVISSSSGTYSIQATVAHGENVYLVTKADPTASTTSGDYRLDASLNVNATPFMDFISGTLTNANPGLGRHMIINRGLVAHFVLTQSAQNPSNDFGAVVQVKNAAGAIVWEFGAPSSRSVSASQYLAPGVYQIIVGGAARIAGSTLPEINVSLKGFSLSDPIDPIGGTPDVDDDMHPDETEDCGEDVNWELDPFWWLWI